MNMFKFFSFLRWSAWAQTLGCISSCMHRRLWFGLNQHQLSFGRKTSNYGQCGGVSLFRWNSTYPKEFSKTSILYTALSSVLSILARLKKTKRLWLRLLPSSVTPSLPSKYIAVHENSILMQQQRTPSRPSSILKLAYSQAKVFLSRNYR